VTTAILTHGGAASSATLSDGCEVAARAALVVLERGGDALVAAIEATRILEDDERYNAGTGSNLRLDGAMVQMDAAVMVSDARFGAVGCIERVRNPILVAARVMDTPHLMLVGEGATAFARRLGHADYDPVTERARNKHARAMAELAGRGDGVYADDAAPWRGDAVDRCWNFALARGCDTVGAVVRDARGTFCATASTGGTVYMLRGRVGDSPLIGCGLFAGPLGAVACTGVGEEIARRLLAKTVYDWIAAGMSPRDAGARAVALFDPKIDVGLLIASKDDCAIASNRDMARAQLR
jgi:L-asparaginase/beta-aspartyl-peptidase (threonine type)